MPKCILYVYRIGYNPVWLVAAALHLNIIIEYVYNKLALSACEESWELRVVVGWEGVERIVECGCSQSWTLLVN